MVIGFAGGCIFAGMILGAITGSILMLVGGAAAGFAIAGISEAVKRHNEEAANHQRLGQYPPYGY